MSEGGRIHDRAETDLGDRPWSVASETTDTPAEVDAASRTLRRIAVGYALLFLAVVAAYPLLSLALDWWSQARLPAALGGLSPGFLTAAVGLYVVFAGMGIAVASLSSAVEARMLGSVASDPDQVGLDDIDGRNGPGGLGDTGTHR